MAAVKSPRRFTRHHFALYRGYLGGVGLRELHGVYGDAGAPAAETERLIVTLRDALSAAARRTCDGEAAHLLRLRPGSLQDRLARAADAADPAQVARGEPSGQSGKSGHPGRRPLPSLDDYRAQVDPDGFYGEAELLELYLADYPPGNVPDAVPGTAPSDAPDSAPDRAIARKIARNARLRERQAAALARMERALAADPAATDPVDGWFEPAVAARLMAAGLATLGALLERIAQRRQRWY
ncbi:MAG: hypothetical protein LBV73_19665, partial [Paraburkholderia sp.]|nr:hypothetical protein [Paraburkholderia sp.]